MLTGLSAMTGLSGIMGGGGSGSDILFRYSAGDSIAALGGTFTRASTGGYRDAAQALQSAASGVLRDSHYELDPVSGLYVRSALLEGQRTNLFLNSAAAVTQNVTVTAAAHTLSFYGTGTITLSGTSTAGPLVGTGAGNRVSLTFTPTAGTLTLTVSGSCTQTLLELGSFPSSYIPTVASTVTRAADVLSFPFAFAPQELTVFCRFINLGLISADGGRAYTFGASSSPAPFLNYGASGTTRLSTSWNSNVGGAVNSSPTTTFAIGDAAEGRNVLSASGTILSGVAKNGGSEAMGTESAARPLVAAFSGPLLWLGSQATSSYGTAAFRDIIIAKGTRDLAYFRALVSP